MCGLRKLGVFFLTFLIVCYQSDEKDRYDDDDESMIFTTPRTICALSDLLNCLDLNMITSLLKEKYTTDSGETDNRFNEIIYAHVGKTKFAAKFLIQFAKDYQKEIDRAAANRNGNDQSAAELTIEKPAEYDDLCSMKTRDSLCSYLDTLDNPALLGLLLYCLHDEDKRNQSFIVPIAERAALDAHNESLQRIGEYMATGRLCKDHVAELMRAETPLTPFVAHYNNPTHFFNS